MDRIFIFASLQEKSVYQVHMSSRNNIMDLVATGLTQSCPDDCRDPGSWLESRSSAKVV